MMTSILRSGRCFQAVPAQLLPRQINHWTALPRVIIRQRLFHQRQPWVDPRPYLLSQLTDRELIGVPQIDRTGVIPMHQTDQTLDQITDVTERPRLTAIPIKGQILPPCGENARQDGGDRRSLEPKRRLERQCGSAHFAS